MKILYLDCFSGISGDMLLGALLMLDAPLEMIEAAFRSLAIPTVHLQVSKVLKQGITAYKVSFETEQAQETSRTYKEVREIVGNANLKPAVKQAALRCFEMLATAEATIHGIHRDQVHFHEVGGIDTICDVVGAMIAMDALAIEAVYTSPLPYGTGEIACSHGILPNPAPATVELLKGFEMFSLPNPVEFVTPTGAALLRSWVTPGVIIPPYRVLKVGYGAGDHEVSGRPNILRAVLGQSGEGTLTDQVILLETDIDDESPEILAHITQALFGKGALDVTSQPVFMKKGRLGNRLTVVSPPELKETLADYLLSETSTLGIRMVPSFRRLLKRELIRISTSLGEATIKVATLPDGRKRISPEYEDCAQLASRHQLPIRQVIDIVRSEAKLRLGIY